MALSGVAWTVEGMVEMEDALRRIFLLFLVVAGRKETRREETRCEEMKAIATLLLGTQCHTRIRAGVLIGVSGSIFEKILNGGCLRVN